MLLGLTLWAPASSSHPVAGPSWGDPVWATVQGARPGARTGGRDWEQGKTDSGTCDHGWVSVQPAFVEPRSQGQDGCWE